MFWPTAHVWVHFMTNPCVIFFDQKYFLCILLELKIYNKCLKTNGSVLNHWWPSKNSFRKILKNAKVMGKRPLKALLHTCMKEAAQCPPCWVPSAWPRRASPRGRAGPRSSPPRWRPAPPAPGPGSSSTTSPARAAGTLQTINQWISKSINQSVNQSISKSIST